MNTLANKIGLAKKIGLGAALAATTLAVAAPAQARDHYRRGDDGAAIALGVLSIAAFAALAASERDHYYYRDGYYYPRAYYPRYRYNYNYNYSYPVYPRYNTRYYYNDYRYRDYPRHHRYRRHR
jgi:hypothetical protein